MHRPWRRTPGHSVAYRSSIVGSLCISVCRRQVAASAGSRPFPALASAQRWRWTVGQERKVQTIFRKPVQVRFYDDITQFQKRLVRMRLSASPPKRKDGFEKRERLLKTFRKREEEGVSDFYSGSKALWSNKLKFPKNFSSDRDRAMYRGPISRNTAQQTAVFTQSYRIVDFRSAQDRCPTARWSGTLRAS